MPESYLYGLNHASHVFTKEESFGKNVFTNAFPVALVNYIDSALGLDQNYITAELDEDGELVVKHDKVPLTLIIGLNPERAFWAIEDSFSGYDAYANGTPNRSDLVVRDRKSGVETSAFEIKLVAVPTSDTARLPRAQQGCEIVVRPPSIEQMCFSLAASYGEDRRHEIGDIITEKLGNPMDYEWNNKGYMARRIGRIVDAAESLAVNVIDSQTPFVLNAIWRTNGQSLELDEECFDVFFWSDVAFLNLFIHAARKDNPNTISRVSRSLVWLVKCLLDYSVQGGITFDQVKRNLSYSLQNDKAASFTKANIVPFITCDDFLHPRVSGHDYTKIISREGVAMLQPERRLDAVIIKTELDKILADLKEEQESLFR